MRDVDADDNDDLLLFLSSDEPTPKYPVEDLGSKRGGVMYGVGAGGVKAQVCEYCGKDHEKDGGGAVPPPVAAPVPLPEPLPLPLPEPLPERLLVGNL
jgi:hypothetical protein